MVKPIIVKFSKNEFEDIREQAWAATTWLTPHRYDKASFLQMRLIVKEISRRTGIPLSKIKIENASIKKEITTFVVSRKAEKE